MPTDRERALDSLQHLQRLFDFAWREEQAALKQSESMKEVKDFRAMDRHASYAMAMLKMQHQIRAIASNWYEHNLIFSETSGGLNQTKD